MKHRGSSSHTMDTPDRHNKRTDKRTCLFVRLSLTWSLTVREHLSSQTRNRQRHKVTRPVVGSVFFPTDKWAKAHMEGLTSFVEGLIELSQSLCRTTLQYYVLYIGHTKVFSVCASPLIATQTLSVTSASKSHTTWSTANEVISSGANHTYPDRRLGV